MPYRLTPQDIVTRLDNCLDNLKTMADQEQVENIRRKLDVIKVYYPTLKDLEMRVITKLRKIGSEISGDDVLKKHDDATKVEERLQSIYEILLGIEEITKENKISSAEDKVRREQDSSAKRQAMESSSSDWLEANFESRVLKSLAISSLEVSFNNLDYPSRLCSLCLSVFPENFEIKKRPLIYWWMGEGFVRETDDHEKSAEEVGEEIFKKLYRKGLVQAVNKGKNPIVDSCMIHPWMRKMLITVAREAQFLDFDENGRLKDTFDKSQSRRACLVEGKEMQKKESEGKEMQKKDSEVKEMQKLKESINMLAVVFNVDKKYLKIESELWSNLKRVKALQLGRWQRSPEHHIDLEIIGDTKKPRDDSQAALVNLRDMKQLKYLSLQGISSVTDLPDSISKLLNLEILDLRACHNLGKLPSAIGSLHNLTHLDVTECYFLESMPKGIEKLRSLQVLKGFMLGAYQANSCKLRDLSSLPKLRKLSIYIRAKAYLFVEQGHFPGLSSLTITWGGGTWGTQQGTEAKSFELPESLEKLDLRCYPFNKLPEWSSPTKLKKLKKLYIRGGSLESFDKYDGLEILRLKYLEKMKKVTFLQNERAVPCISINEKDTEFPSLEYYEMVRKAGDDAFEWTNCETAAAKVAGARKGSPE